MGATFRLIFTVGRAGVAFTVMDTPVFGNVADYAEEQRGELEALESIFGSDLKGSHKLVAVERWLVLTSSLRCVTAVLKVESTSSSFTIKLVPYSDSTSKNYVGVTLHCTYTPVYPDELPDVRRFWRVSKRSSMLNCLVWVHYS
jgi:RWD domain